MKSSTEFRISLDWESADGVRDAALAATWARLGIFVGDECITMVQDSHVRTTRDCVYTSVYPLAEWLACHWFHLRFENISPEKRVNRGFWHRHNIRSGRDGMPFPDLSIISEGAFVRLEWKQWEAGDLPVKFLTNGSAHISMESFEESIANFLTLVSQRIHEIAPGLDTPMQEEWSAVGALSEEELEFCEYSAQMGLDPFSVPLSRVKGIIRSSEEVPKQFREDFFRASTLDSLSGNAAWVKAALKMIDSSSDTSLESLRLPNSKNLNADTPWNMGYKLAQKLRKTLGFDSDFVKTNVLNEAVGMNRAATVKNRRSSFTALVYPGGSQKPGIVLADGRETSKRFSFARALAEYILGRESLVSDAVTYRQQLTRAFAAELLAPAQSIKSQLSRSGISPDEIEELSDKYQVSPFVIQYQIENHRLGELQLS